MTWCFDCFAFVTHDGVAGEHNGVGITHNPEVRQTLILVGLGEREDSLQIVGWDLRTRSAVDA